MGVGGANIPTTFTHFLLPLLILLLLGFVCHGSENIAGSEIAAVRCIEGERQALLHFKAALTDTSARLSSWIGDDCCSWRGVGCSNVTGHVIKLDLPNQLVLREEFPDGVDSGFYMEIDWEATDKSSLGGNISPSLLKLKHLDYLDLSLNNFNGSHIPEFMGSLENLRDLNLSGASFSGTIPPHLGNLSRLQCLDLSMKWWAGLTINNIQWLSGLSSLRYLNMDYVSFTSEYLSFDWIQVVSILPSLSELHLSDCQLSKISFSLPLFANLTSLLVLDLSNNHFDSTIPPWLFNITTLTVLDLSGNYDLNGPIPNAFANTSSLQDLDLSETSIGGRLPRTLGNVCNLQRLDLSGCSNISGEITEYVNSLSMCNCNSLETLRLQLTGVSGVIPSSIGNLSSLTELDLSDTQISGPIPMSIGGLSSLTILDLSYNTQMDGTVPESIGELSKLETLILPGDSLRGVISERHFKNVKSLRYLSIESEEPNKALVFEVGWDWIPTFTTLEKIQMSNIQMSTPRFPLWLATQKELQSVSLKNVGISDTIPDYFWNNLCAQQNDLELDLSHNQINGTIPKSLEFFNADLVDLSYNRIEGSLPLWSNVSYLNLGTNLFTGQIPHNIGEVFGSDVIQGLDFSGNFLDGSIPSSICELKSLQWLILSNNSLWGELPHCWKDMEDLQVLDLSYNNLSGKIPNSIGSLSSLEYLILSSNNFHGKLPSSLQNCTSLSVIDLGRNGFAGKIPTWIGESLSSLQIISLRSNFLTGKIPLQVCNLSMLHLLDLSYNNLTGFIPQCLGDLSALNSKDSDHWLVDSTSRSSYYVEHMIVVTKGRELEYSTTLDLVNSIDLSSNHLSGEIPNGITRLVLLDTLNLSMNHLTGKIPEKIGFMQYLETLDLSTNELSGQIPPSMSSLTLLNHLNLSHNSLSGKIPTSTQLQSIGDASMYIGNPGLCGLPLANICPGDMSPPPPKVNGENDDKVDEEWMDMLRFYIGIIMGFIVGFWAIWGVLIFNKSWRIAYFHYIECAVHICGGS